MKFRPAGAVFIPAEVHFEPAGVVFSPAEVHFKSAGVVFGPAGVHFEPAVPQFAREVLHFGSAGLIFQGKAQFGHFGPEGWTVQQALTVLKAIKRTDHPAMEELLFFLEACRY